MSTPTTGNVQFEKLPRGMKLIKSLKQKNLQIIDLQKRIVMRRCDT